MALRRTGSDGEAFQLDLVSRGSLTLTEERRLWGTLEPGRLTSSQARLLCYVSVIPSHTLARPRLASALYLFSTA